MNKGTLESILDEESEYSTNRPAFEGSSVGSRTSFRLNHNVTTNDITNLTSMGGFLRNSLRQPPSATTMDTTTEENRLRQHYNHSMSSGSSISNRPPLTSPPRNIPFSIEASSLRGTPVHEQARILTNNTFEQLGIRSSESESSQQRLKATEKKKEEFGRAWQESNMDKDDEESRAKFNEFLQKRQVRLQDMQEGVELETIRPRVKSPSDRARHLEEEPLLVGTPTMERVVANLIQKDLQHEVPRNEEISDFDVEMEDNISALAKSPNSFNVPSFTPLRDPVSDIGAYEFTNSLNQQSDHYMGTPSSTRTGGSDMTMKQGQHTSLIPAQFHLQYFPEKFRSPPASIKLTKVYNEFNDRPGTMLTKQQVIEFINDTSYTEEYVSILISLLTRKKYLKKVGNHDAWVIRR
jgi:hypothetical protein